MDAPFPDLREQFERARLFALDVDGVLTDGGVVYVGDKELQRFDVKDGAALVWLRENGIELAFITGRGCTATKRRADELGVAYLSMREGSKAATLERIQRLAGVTPSETLAMGDDLADFGLAERAAVFAAPADAVPEIRSRADWVTAAPGGRGAVREFAELVLRARSAWPPIPEASGR